MRFVDPGAIGECDARTQGALVAEATGATRTRQRAAERSRATQLLIV